MKISLFVNKIVGNTGTGINNQPVLLWKLQYGDVQADATGGRAHWDAHYRFSATGRIVDKSIDAQFEFNPAGQIVRHQDRFDFWRWSRQALGVPGILLGWTPMLRGKVRGQAGANLQRFLAKEPQ